MSLHLRAVTVTLGAGKWSRVEMGWAGGLGVGNRRTCGYVGRLAVAKAELYPEEILG